MFRGKTLFSLKQKLFFISVTFRDICRTNSAATLRHRVSLLNRYLCWRIKDQLDALAILFHFLCVQHVWEINISIIRSLRLFCWIATLVVLFLVRCVLGVSVWYPCCRLKPATRIPLQANHTETPTHVEPRTIRPIRQFNRIVASSWWWIY